MTVAAIVPQSDPSAVHVRLQLAHARNELRAAQDAYDLVTADAEQRMIDLAGGAKSLGANAEDRARALRLALSDDEDYRDALAALRAAQAEVDRLSAEVEILLDARKAADRDSRDRLTTALQQLGVADGEHPADGLTVQLATRRAA